MKFAKFRLPISLLLFLGSIWTCPAEPVPLADPFILPHNGSFYAYGTYDNDGIIAYVSRDLKSWKKAEGRAEGGRVMWKGDVFGEKYFWAPEVYEKNGKFYLFYSAEEHVCVAEADHPLGPFRQQKKETLFPLTEKNIDASLLFDDNGTPWMYYAKIDGGNHIWCVRLTPDLKSVVPGTERHCLSVELPWERTCGIVAEGPSVIKFGGKYILLYSANDYRSPDYAVGCAAADTPCGPWVKCRGTPFLKRVGNLVGTGHGAPFRVNGEYGYVFHAHHSRKNVHPRYMFIVPLTIRMNDGMPEISIGSVTECKVINP